MSSQRIYAALRARGTSVPAWARAHGYQPRTVYQVIERWAHRTDRPPHGGMARQIIADLRAELGPELVPAPRRPAA